MQMARLLHICICMAESEALETNVAFSLWVMSKAFEWRTLNTAFERNQCLEFFWKLLSQLKIKWKTILFKWVNLPKFGRKVYFVHSDCTRLRKCFSLLHIVGPLSQFSWILKPFEGKMYSVVFNWFFFLLLKYIITDFELLHTLSMFNM